MILIILGIIKNTFSYFLKISISVILLIVVFLIFMQIEFSINGDDVVFYFYFEDISEELLIEYPTGNFIETNQTLLNNSIVFYIEGNYSSQEIMERYDRISKANRFTKKYHFYKLITVDDIEQIEIEPKFISGRIIKFIL